MPTLAQPDLPDLPEPQPIRAVIVTDPRTTPVTPLVMIYRTEFAVRVYPSEIDSLIDQLKGLQWLFTGDKQNAVSHRPTP